MRVLFSIAVCAVTLCGGLTSAQPSEANVAPVEYSDPYDDDFPLLGYVSIPEQTPAPAVIIIPDSSSVNDYEKLRATMLKEMGYVGFAADIYGPDFQEVELDSTTRRNLTGTYRGNNTLFFGRIQAAVDLLKDHPDVIPDKIAIIGYCFGGTGVLTFSFMGGSDVVGAVSFHGGLTEFPVTGVMSNPVLVLSGGDDDTGTEVDDLEARLNEANATWQITRYSGIEHAFTVWDDDRYNKRANERSWQEMSSFLEEAFGIISYESSAAPPNSTNVESVEYDDDGFPLTGYLAIPESATQGGTPAVVIIPGWAGVEGPDGDFAKRATLLAEQGYVGFVGDVYGSDLQMVESFEERGQLAGMYRTNYTLFVSRLQAAVDLVAAHDMVDPEKIFMIGYCFGGTGVVDYAFAGLKNVKAVVPFHGGLTSLAPVQTDVVYPYVLVQSGGVDDAHGNNTQLEMQLDYANATWEISRYSNVEHGFTHWGGDAYNALADWRSWDAMLDVFQMILDGDLMGGHDDHDGHEHDHDHDDHDHDDGTAAVDEDGNIIPEIESGSCTWFLGPVVAAAVMTLSCMALH